MYFATCSTSSFAGGGEVLEVTEVLVVAMVERVPVKPIRLASHASHGFLFPCSHNTSIPPNIHIVQLSLAKPWAQVDLHWSQSLRLISCMQISIVLSAAFLFSTISGFLHSGHLKRGTPWVQGAVQIVHSIATNSCSHSLEASRQSLQFDLHCTVKEERCKVKCSNDR